MIKLFLDDLRMAPPGWTKVTTMAEAQYLIETEVIEELSLDHDLGLAPMCDDCVARENSEDEVEDPCDCRCSCHQTIAPTGYDLVKWMAYVDKWSIVKPRVHSQNPVGRQNMQAVIDRYWHSPLH